MSKVGVFICHCGSNISEKVCIDELIPAVSRVPGVAVAVDYRYLCSKAGQVLIKETIKKYNFDRVVIASCSPRLHEEIFRKVINEAGINPYLMEIANIREHVSWTSEQGDESTRKAFDLILMKIKKIQKFQSLYENEIPLTKKALVIGGGIAGITAALSIANSGIPVILVEKSPSIGGNMARINKTFPTLDCAACILTPNMVEAAGHDLITIHAYSEVIDVRGYIGNFNVKIQKKQRYVSAEKCNNCNACLSRCPVTVTSEFDEHIKTRKAIYRPFPNAIPDIPVIDAAVCKYLTEKKCGACQKACPASAIDFNQQEEISEEQIGVIIVATGFSLFNLNLYTEYSFGKHPDIISTMQFERLLDTEGPTNGKILKLSNGKEPKTIVFAHCVGSRDTAKGVQNCSRICCMINLKQIMMAHSKISDVSIYAFYIDIRANGKDYEEFYCRTYALDGVALIKGRISRILVEGDAFIIKAEDINSGKSIRIDADLVVLANGIQAQPDYRKTAQILGIGYNQNGFYSELHPKLRPVETAKAGVFLAGTCQGPKDISETVSHAQAAAAKALEILAKETLQKQPLVAQVLPAKCKGCLLCMENCFYAAISETDTYGKKTAYINPILCQGCGNCSALCLNGAIDIAHCTDEQIYEEIVSLNYQR